MSPAKRIPAGKAHRLGDAKRVVVKVGSALMADESKGAVRTAALANLAEEIARLRARGAEVVMVSSGAIAVGRLHLGLKPGKPAKASTDTSSSNTSTDTSIDPSILDDVPACNLVRRSRKPMGATAMRSRIRGACLVGWHARPAQRRAAVRDAVPASRPASCMPAM